MGFIHTSISHRETVQTGSCVIMDPAQIGVGCREKILRAQTLSPRLLQVLWFNLGFFDFAMVWKQHAITMNGTFLNFDFFSRASYVVQYSVRDVGQRQWVPSPSQPHDHEGKPLIRNSMVLNAFLTWCFQPMMCLSGCNPFTNWGTSTSLFYLWPFFFQSHVCDN